MIEMPTADFVSMVFKNGNCGGRWELRRKKCGNLLKKISTKIAVPTEISIKHENIDENNVA